MNITDLPADLIRLIASANRTSRIPMRLTCRRFCLVLGHDPDLARSFVVDCEGRGFRVLVDWARRLGARLTPEYTDALAAGGDVDRVKALMPPLSDTCLLIACARNDVAMVSALIALGNVYEYSECMAVIDRSVDWSGTPFASGLAVNDGREDRMLMATTLLNKRLREIEQRRGGAPTLAEVEKTHIAFVNYHFKPYATYSLADLNRPNDSTN